MKPDATVNIEDVVSKSSPRGNGGPSGGDAKSDLVWALKRIAQAQGCKLDTLRLGDAISALQPGMPMQAWVMQVASHLSLERPQWMPVPDPVHLPLLCVTPEGFGVVQECGLDGRWRVLVPNGELWLEEEKLLRICARVNARAPQMGLGVTALFGSWGIQPGFIGYVFQTLRLYRSSIAEAALATAFIGFLSLATSLFSMQVYDRVIPTRSEATLIILASGVLLTILFELVMKYARSHVMDHIVIGMDHRLSREVFSRLLSLRVDQLPPSVGSLSGQVRGYEQVRAFYTASTLFTLIELPLGLLFIIIIGLIGHPLVAAVPLVFGALGVLGGLNLRRKIMAVARDGAALSNMKTGLLVEAVEGIETIKAGSGGWKFLAHWVKVTGATIRNDLRMRSATENVGYMSAMLQQISYAGLIVAGAFSVMNGHMTMGALIACSILSGRVLAPIMALPGLLVQHAHAKAALEGLEKLYQLKVDNHDSENALTPERLNGHYQVTDAKFAYADNPPALVLPALEIRVGERIAVLGPIGSGKSTMLRLLSGMYVPMEGRVLLDGLDLSQIHRQVVSQHVGYLQQEHRLFQGTLRENLLVGLADPGDETILAAMRRTGMDRIVATHPKGLDRVISEGGKGLSGGQKQLVAFTRLALADPAVLLLDEPTATMDEEQERQCLQVLAEEAARGKTMVFVTHKAVMLPLATRVIVVIGNKVMLDGPRDAVLERLKQRPAPATAADRAAEVVAPAVAGPVAA